MPLFRKEWKILISISWLFGLLKNDIQHESKSHKIIIQLEIELELDLFSKLKQSDGVLVIYR